jgi:hypothetical protein
MDMAGGRLGIAPERLRQRIDQRLVGQDAIDVVG